jgi:hypothetical protein
MATGVRWGLGFVGSVVALACWGGTGCSGGGNTGYGSDDGGDDASADGFNSFTGETGTEQLLVTPQNKVIDVSAPGVTVPFMASLSDSPTTPVKASWTIDVASIGTIDASGMFTASGMLGGPTHVAASSGKLTASTLLTVHLHLTDNPGNVDGATQQKLTTGGMGDPAFKWLYPYDKTIFPRGLPAPDLQFGGTAPDAEYVHVTVGNGSLDYKGFYGPSSPGAVTLSPQLWKTISESAGASDAVTVEVTKISAGVVSGPVAETWHIAQGNLKGTVYYETWNSPSITGGRALMKVKPGTPAVALFPNCHGCHVVSADGSTMVARNDINGSFSDSYDLKNGAATIHEDTTQNYWFAGAYPDGSFVMSNGAPGASWPPNVPGTSGPRTAQLFDTKNDANIPAPGWDGVLSYAMMPSFSPDGKAITFNDYDMGQGHSIATMQFANATKTFTNRVEIATDPNSFLGWPSFTPDDEWVIYQSGDRGDFATWQGAKGDIMIAHLPSKTVAPLDLMNGTSNGTSYLPYGDTEMHLNYEPHLLPVAAGGYYWVVLTSRRYYGNTVTDASQDTIERKKLWVVPLDIDSSEHPSQMAHDISHPAFYLPGQETLTAGNARGFWALDPCMQNGNACETGDECCTGFCRQTTGADGGMIFACVPPQTGCAHMDEKCSTTADCCDSNSGAKCINGFCSQPAAQ